MVRARPAGFGGGPTNVGPGEKKSHLPDFFETKMNKSFNERRKNVRINRNFILTYHEKDKISLAHDISQVNNVSKGGMNFSTAHPIEAGAVVVVDIKAPFIADPMRLEGQVLDCREKVPGIIYEIRIQFQAVPPESVSALEKIEKYSKLNKE